MTLPCRTATGALSVPSVAITSTPAIWSRVTWSWTAFFAAMAALNWYVAFHYPTDIWVNFKVFGGIGLFVLFAVAQVLMLSRYITEPQKP